MRPADLLAAMGRVHVSASGHPYQTYIAQASDCAACALRGQCLKKRRTKEGDKKDAKDEWGRQVARFFPRPQDLSHPSERMRQAIDSPRGRQLYSQGIGTVEPVLANLRHDKRLSRLKHRGQAKVRTQWSLYCMVHNIEKLSNAGLGQMRASNAANKRHNRQDSAKENYGAKIQTFTPMNPDFPACKSTPTSRGAGACGFGVIGQLR